MPDTRKIAENSTFQVVSRLAMLSTPFLIGLISWLAVDWLDRRLQAPIAEIASVRERVTTIEQANYSQAQLMQELRGQVIVLQTQAEDRERFQRETLTKLDRMQESIVALSNTVAGLTATIRTMQRDGSRAREVRPVVPDEAMEVAKSEERTVDRPTTAR